MDNNHNHNQSRWKHPHGFDILKKLGIVERSANSLSEGDEEYDKPVKFKKKDDSRIAADESDEEVIFDRDSLLKTGNKNLLRHRRSIDCAKSLHCQTILLSVAFFIVGLCLAIVGPTLPDLQLHTKSLKFSSTVSVVSANSLGIILGISCAANCYKLLNALCVMTFALWLCALTTLVIPWCSTLTAAAFVFIAQGLSLGFVIKGVYTLFYAYWKRKYNVFLCFYVALAFGATMSPLVTSSFVANQLKHSQITTLTVSQSSPPLMVKREAVDFGLNNSTFNNESWYDGMTICNDSGNNCLNVTSTEIQTSTPKIKKPQVNDATNQEPPHLHADSNKKEVLPPAKQVPIVKAATTPNLSTSPVSATNFTIETFNSTTFTTPTTAFSSSSQSMLVQNDHPTTRLVDTTVSEQIITTIPFIESTKKEVIDNPTDVGNSGMSFGNNAVVESVSHTSEDETANSTISPHLLQISTSVMNSTVEDVIASTSKTFAMSDVPRNVWDYMLQRVAELNNVRVAYLVISVISFVSTTFYVFMCCCSSCRSFKPAFGIDGDADEKRFQLNQLCSNRINLYASLVSWLFCFLSGGVESIMSNLLTVYCVTGMWQEQSSGVLLTTTYWFFVSLGRMAALGFYKKLWQTNSLVVCLAFSFVSCGIMVVFSKSWIVLCICVAAIGLTTGHLTPMMFCWLDQQLGLESWFVTAWLCSYQIGRATLAPLTAYGMLNHSPHMMPIVVLICTVFLSVVTVVMRKIVIQASQMNVADLVVVTRHIKSSDGKKLLEYHRHIDEIDGSDSD